MSSSIKDYEYFFPLPEGHPWHLLPFDLNSYTAPKGLCSDTYHMVQLVFNGFLIELLYVILGCSLISSIILLPFIRQRKLIYSLSICLIPSVVDVQRSVT